MKIEFIMFDLHGKLPNWHFFLENVTRYVKISRKIMHIVLENLALEQLIVIYPGDKTYPLAENITVQPLPDAIHTPPTF